jgi:hypothetical protein
MSVARELMPAMEAATWEWQLGISRHLRAVVEEAVVFLQ